MERSILWIIGEIACYFKGKDRQQHLKDFIYVFNEGRQVNYEFALFALTR